MIEIAVKDMTCGHCASVITKAVRETDAAARCEIDLAARQVRIDSAAAAQPFVAAIAEAGYTPVLAAPAS
ncbi:MAG TPA: heavy-metal-associated domain-containing protein [Usitatibacteraceae bacterium]|nr:heavy-metal-associated domain-containing protein [Usitatibacteraceae bacterium]